MLGQAANRAVSTPAPPACGAPHRQAWTPCRRPQNVSQRQQQRGGGSSSGSSSIAAAKCARPGRQQRLSVAASASSDFTPKTGREKIPIFPLSIVALPAADVPLQIFEARYRVLFSTLMAGAKGVDEGLVNSEKPWCGSRLFGMAFYDQQSQGLASMGTLLQIQEHTNLEDGRILVNNVGRQRFRILNVIEEKPVLVCEVEYLPDSEEPDADSPEARALAAEVGELFRNVVSLSIKLKDASVPADIADPKQLRELNPLMLSFWVASLFAGNPYQQQALLEEDSTLARLKAEKELLSGTVKYLGAQAALQSAFKTTGGGGASPPPGGPD